MGLNIALAAIVIAVFLFTGNFGLGLIALLVSAIVALRLGRRDTKSWHRQPLDRATPMAVTAMPERDRPNPATPQPALTPDPLDTIARLADLRDRGVITPEEFDAKKKELLERA